MPTNFLERVAFEHAIKRGARGPVYPEMLEMEVNPELGPFLVSSTRGVVWVERLTADGTLRVATRTRIGLEADLLAAITDFGTRMAWGNVHPLTPGGIAGAIAHVRSYGMDAVELLVSDQTDRGSLGHERASWVEAPWVPVDAVVVLPVDRSYVGVLGTLGPERACAMVHNASRGVGVAWYDGAEVAGSGNSGIAAT